MRFSNLNPRQRLWLGLSDIVVASVGGRMLDVSDSHLCDYYWSNEHSSAIDAPLAAEGDLHGLGLVDGFDMGNGASVGARQQWQQCMGRQPIYLLSSGLNTNTHKGQIMFKAFHGIRMVSKVFLTMCLLVLAQLANAQRPEPPPIEERRYEDSFTFKPTTAGWTFTKDPWTWGYTKEFAERFRMPEKWIEPEMKGILAIAFRVSDVGQPVTCGLNGREESCWPQMICQFDIYYDNRIKLPWIAEIGVRDNLLNGISSQAFTWQRSPNQETRYKRGPNSAEKSLYLMRIGFDNAIGGYRQFPVSFTYYDQEFAPGVGLIGIAKGGCPNYSFDKGDFWLDFFVDKAAQEKSKELPRTQLKNIGVIHEALVPESFMTRVNVAREAGQKANEQVMNRLMREFQQRKSGQ